MLCGAAAVLQASGSDSAVFDPFSFQQDGLAAPQVDVSRYEVGDALCVSLVFIVGEEVRDPLFEMAGEASTIDVAANTQ
jgi:hypothetical protein